MTRFKSLLYREFAVSRKYNITKFALLILFSLGCVIAVGILPNAAQDGAELGAVLPMFGTLFAMMLLAFPALFTISDDVIVTDINSGWGRYSRTLPMTPAERSAVRIARYAILNAVGLVIGFIFSVIVCMMIGRSFDVRFIAMMFIAIDSSILFRIATDFFALRSKTPEEYAKNAAKPIYLFFAVIVIAVAAVLIFGDIDLSEFFAMNDDMDAESMDPLKFIPTASLIGTVPLMFLLTGVHYLVGKRAFENTASLTKVRAKADEDEKVDLTAPHIDIDGFVYKEFVQNKSFFRSTAIMPFFGAAFVAVVLLLASFAEFVQINAGNMDHFVVRWLTSGYARALIMVTASLCSGAFMLNVFGNDQKKKWTYFVASSPDGIKRAIYSKYVTYFAMDGVFFLSCYLVEGILATLRWAVIGEEATSVMSVAVILFFFTLLGDSVRIPLIIRYDEKRAAAINAIIILVFGMIIVLLAAFMPEEAMDAIFGWLAKFINGDNIGDIAVLLIGIFPVISIAAYVISYKFSAKLFLKGANECVK